MAMVRVNIQLDEKEYGVIKTLAFAQKKSYAQVIREGLKPLIESNKQIHEKLELVLEEDDENRIMNIIEKNKYSDWNNFKEEQGLV
ncbi:MAG: hypothetical protein U0457_12875 [Candidatus Sericytochromatia bacterium]